MQAVVSGPVAGELRELVSDRWENATGTPLPSLAERGDSEELWPASVPVQATESDTAIARTWTSPDGEDLICEVKRLYADMIESARHSIYIENQYFTSAEIADALAARLKQEQGPEVVIVLPAETSGWLEQATMDILRNRAIAALEEADRFDRLRIVTPVSDDLGDVSITVHAKIMVVDNALARIGSANLSRRSMGLDSECDVVVADKDAATALCADLLSEHLAADIDEVSRHLLEQGLIATLDHFSGKARRLAPLEIDASDVEQALLEPVAKVADLEKPIMRSSTI